jgi:glycosyltransferase involved in cell wall biosynthesis
MEYREHVAAAAYEASLLGQLTLPPDYLQRPLGGRLAIARPWYNDLLRREASGDPRAEWLLTHFPNLRFTGQIPFQPAARRRAMPSVAVIGPSAYVGGAELWCEALVKATAGRINWRGFGVCGAGQIDPIMLERWERLAPVALGEDNVRRLCKAADITVGWGVSGVRAVVPARKLMVSVSHSPGQSKWARRLHHSMPENIDAWVAVSRLALGAIPARFRKQAVVIPNGADPERCRASQAHRTAVRRSWGITDKNIRVVGMLGRISLEKDVGALIRAIKALPKRYVGIAVGDGSMDQQGLAAAALKTGRVKILPAVSDVGPVLAGFDMLLGASDYESFWLAGVEAMLARKPIVSTKVGILVDHPKLACLIPVRAKGRVIAEAILRDEASSDRDARIDRAEQIARERWTLDTFGDAWATYLEGLSSKRGQPGCEAASGRT